MTRGAVSRAGALLTVPALPPVSRDPLTVRAHADSESVSLTTSQVCGEG